MKEPHGTNQFITSRAKDPSIANPTKISAVATTCTLSRELFPAPHVPLTVGDKLLFHRVQNLQAVFAINMTGPFWAENDA